MEKIGWYLSGVIVALLYFTIIAKIRKKKGLKAYDVDVITFISLFSWLSIILLIISFLYLGLNKLTSKILGD